jgi:hypothetical protein
MAKHTKSLHRHHHKVVHAAKSRVAKDSSSLVIIRGWMFVVVFALMLGVGAIIGTFINAKLAETTPAVAGVQTVAQ